MDSQKYEAFRTEFVARLWGDIYPFAHVIEDTESIPPEVFPIFREMRAWALMVPEEYGGRGLTASQYIPLLVELAKVHGGLRTVVHVHNSNAHAFSVFGSTTLKQEILPSVAVGEKSIAFGLTEPDHG